MSDLEFLIKCKELVNSIKYEECSSGSIVHLPDHTIHFDDDVMDVFENIGEIKLLLDMIDLDTVVKFNDFYKKFGGVILEIPIDEGIEYGL